jgi:hypothetical protein
MKPEISRVSQISPDQSVVCILGKNEIPESLKLSKPEKEFAKKKIAARDEYVIINSYFKTTYIVRTKDGAKDQDHEELRKTASICGHSSNRIIIPNW